MFLLQNLFRIHVNPHCEVYPVGSSANGLGFQGSALDAIAYVKSNLQIISLTGSTDISRGIKFII